MYCKNCGKELLGDGVFCPACGTKTPAASSTVTSKKKQKRKKSGKRGLFIALGAAVVVVAAGIGVSAIMEIGPFEPKDGVYVITKATYPKYEVTTENTLDDKGDVVHSSFSCYGDSEGYSRTRFEQNSTYDEHGLRTSVTGDDMLTAMSAGFSAGMSYVWQGGCTTGITSYTNVKFDDNNRLLAFTADATPTCTDEGVDENGATKEANTTTVSYTYNGNGTINSTESNSQRYRVGFGAWSDATPDPYHLKSSTSTDNNGNIISRIDSTEYDAGGRYESTRTYNYELNAKGLPTEVSCTFQATTDAEYDKKFPGRSIEPKTSSISLSYDENDNISGVYKDGELVAQFEYQYIDSPSPFVAVSTCNRYADIIQETLG